MDGRNKAGPDGRVAYSELITVKCSHGTPCLCLGVVCSASCPDDQNAVWIDRQLLAGKYQRGRAEFLDDGGPAKPESGWQ